MPRVLNKETGKTHDVPAGHSALNDPLYEVLPDAAPVVAPKVEPEAVPKARAPKARARRG